VHGDEGEDAQLVEREPDNQRVEVDLLPGPERDEPEGGEAAHHGRGQQDREDALVALQESEDRVPRLALARRHHGFC